MQVSADKSRFCQESVETLDSNSIERVTRHFHREFSDPTNQPARKSEADSSFPQSD